MELQSAQEESRSSEQAPGASAASSREPESAAAQLPPADIELQAPCPWYESLEWQLGQLAWQEQGLNPFLEEFVPYHVNNSGRTSQRAAAVLFENLCESEPPAGPIWVLEIGAGSGLFARLL